MPENAFRPGPGRYGTHIVPAVAHFGGGPTIGNATTTIFPLMGAPAVKAFRTEGIRLQAVTAGVDTGTLTFQLFKRNSAGTEVALTAATSLETDFLTGTLPRVIPVAYAAAVTEANRLVDPEQGEHLIVRVVSQTSVSTQPNVQLTVECAMVR